MPDLFGDEYDIFLYFASAKENLLGKLGFY